MSPRDTSTPLDLGDPLHVPLPRPDPRPGIVYELDPPDWPRIFGNDAPLRVEIGVGNSMFLVDLARQEPDFNYVGFEYSLKRVEKFLKKVRRADLENIRMISQDVRRVLSLVFEPGSIDHFFILFPDPWPKNRHAHHRFVRPERAELLARLLRPGGGLTLRTDDAPYAYQMARVLGDIPDLVNRSHPGPFAPRPRHAISTSFQEKWEEEGRPIFYLEYEKRA